MDEVCIEKRSTSTFRRRKIRAQKVCYGKIRLNLQNI